MKIFKEKIPGKNVIPKANKKKYNNLRLYKVGNKILSENYFQHADHFYENNKRAESSKKTKFSSGLKKKKK